TVYSWSTQFTLSSASPITRPPNSTPFPYTTLFRSTLAMLSQDKIKHIRYRTNFYCPTCEEKVIVRAGPHMIPHFAHYSKSKCSRSEEHTSELQSRFDLVCRLLLEKKNNYQRTHRSK